MSRVGGGFGRATTTGIYERNRPPSFWAGTSRALKDCPEVGLWAGPSSVRSQLLRSRRTSLRDCASSRMPHRDVTPPLTTGAGVLPREKYLGKADCAGNSDRVDYRGVSTLGRLIRATR